MPRVGGLVALFRQKCSVCLRDYLEILGIGMNTTELKFTPLNPIPVGGEAKFVLTRDKVRVRVAFWPYKQDGASNKKAKGTICLFQGRTEFIEKYFEVIEDLRERGFNVATLDWRGQGFSQRRFKNRYKGHVRTFKQYSLDMEAFIATVKQTYPGPYYALAHSMGGHIIFANSANGVSNFFDRIVLTAPMLHLAPQMLIKFPSFRKKPPAHGAYIASQRPTRLLTGLLRWFGLGGMFAPGGSKTPLFPFSDNPLTSDRERYDRMIELITMQPDIGLAAPTVAWANAAMHSMRRILRIGFLKKIDRPILIIASGADQIVSTPAIARAVTQVRVGQIITVRGARHEIMFERDELREQFWAAFDSFITNSKYVAARSEVSASIEKT